MITALFIVIMVFSFITGGVGVNSFFKGLEIIRQRPQWRTEAYPGIKAQFASAFAGMFMGAVMLAASVVGLTL